MWWHVHASQSTTALKYLTLRYTMTTIFLCLCKLYILKGFIGGLMRLPTFMRVEELSPKLRKDTRYDCHCKGTLLPNASKRTRSLRVNRPGSAWEAITQSAQGNWEQTCIIAKVLLYYSGVGRREVQSLPNILRRMNVLAALSIRFWRPPE